MCKRQRTRTPTASSYLQFPVIASSLLSTTEFDPSTDWREQWMCVLPCACPRSPRQRLTRNSHVRSDNYLEREKKNLHCVSEPRGLTSWKFPVVRQWCHCSIFLTAASDGKESVLNNATHFTRLQFVQVSCNTMRVIVYLWTLKMLREPFHSYCWHYGHRISDWGHWSIHVW